MVWLQILHAGINDAARRALEAKLNLESLKEQFPFFLDGKRLGKNEGKTEQLRETIADVCELLDIQLTEERRSRVEAMTLAELEALRGQLKALRRWPD